MSEKFLGLQYPIVMSSKGLMAQFSGVKQIKADLLQLLLTNPGERVMLPDYGTPLRELLFEPNDPALEDTARDMIIQSIKLWEPRIIVQAIEVTSNFDTNDLSTEDTGEERGAILGIKILFVDPESIQSIEELVVHMPIEGS